MPTTRIQYQNLPPNVRSKVEETTGAVLTVESVADGLNSAVAVKLHTATAAYFVKALPTDHRWVWTQGREAEVAAFVQSVAPAMIIHIVADGWDVLVFEALDGHHADYRPGSADLPKVVDLICRIGTLAAPDTTLRESTQRLAAYVRPGESLRHLAGEALLHTDWNNTNVIIGEGARIVDWGWATRGAPWLDAGYWVIWLIACGHDPRSAEDWAAQIPAWRAAPQPAVTVFAAVNARMWAEIGGDDPDPWTHRLVTASNRWMHFRRDGLTRT